MQFFRALFASLGSPMEMTTSPLYRYPYRKTGEGLRGDWQKIGKDIESANTPIYMAEERDV